MNIDDLAVTPISGNVHMALAPARVQCTNQMRHHEPEYSHVVVQMSKQIERGKPHDVATSGCRLQPILIHLSRRQRVIVR